MRFPSIVANAAAPETPAPARPSIERLRPQDDSAAGIREALARIDAARTDAAAAGALRRQERDDLLLSGTAAQIAAVEQSLREDEIYLEQLDVLQKLLEPKLSEAIGRALLAEHGRKAGDVERQRARAMAWWRDEYPQLASTIADGLRQMAAAERADYELSWEYVELSKRPEVKAVTGSQTETIMPPQTAAGPAGHPKTTVYPLGQVSPLRVVQLPAGPGSDTPFWWPRELIGRPRPPQ